MSPVIRGMIGAPALAILLLWLLGLAGCALPPPSKMFTAKTPDGLIVEFVPMPQKVIEAMAPKNIAYRPYSVEPFRPQLVVWFRNDHFMSDAEIKHALKHFRRDPLSHTGYCEHLSDGVTWVHPVCQ